MLSSSERTIVKLVAKVSPWLAPLPSGYFVARAGRAYLELPMVMAVVVGLIIELLGITSVHTWLWLIDWNINKRKSDPEAPAVIAAFLGCVYLTATIGLTVMLEVFPGLATYSPAIFPVLAIVGAVNLTLIAQQEGREKVVKQESNDRRLRRELSRSVHQQPVRPNEIVHLSNLAKLDSRMDEANTARKQNKVGILNNIMNIMQNNPAIDVIELARQIGRSRSMTYKYLAELEQSGQIHRNGGDGRSLNL